jgi:threonine dehydrogenase-like Zn-dependent dehydrogenase
VIQAPDDVIIEIWLAGLCGSDLHVYFGHEAPDIGCVVGHELVGVIVQTGTGVDPAALAIGDVVTCPFSTCCGECSPCRLGNTARCQQSQLLGWQHGGGGLSGAQAEYIRIPLATATVVKLGRREAMADNVRPEHLFLADFLPTGYECVLRARTAEWLTRAEASQVPLRLAVVGLGPVGIMTLLSLRYVVKRQASSLSHQIVAIDGVTERLALASSLGIETWNFTDPTAARPDGFHIVFEAVGGPGSPGLRTAFELVAAGGVISSVGVHTPGPQPFPFSAVECYDKNVSLHFGRCSARSLIPELVELLKCNAFEFDFSTLISHRLPLEDEHVQSVYALFAQRKTLKVIFEVKQPSC